MASDDDVVIDLKGLGKSYSLEPRPWRRLWGQLSGRLDHGPQHHALSDVDLQIRRGESVGIIGRNGAGKSTLLQLICGVLQPTRGSRVVRGRIAALLELGAGFNPELTGRENVRLNGPLLGMTAAQMERRLPEIIDFAGIGDYIDQPVRSYSSGMFVRLAFSMATSVEPEILIIDEALSVGDGVFARKSFERIMALKDQGATILFCSHSLFQVESVCTRALWLHDGRVRFDGLSHQASVDYSEWLACADPGQPTSDVPALARHDSPAATLLDVSLASSAGGASLRSGIDTLDIHLHARTDPHLPGPTLGFLIHSADGRVVSSASSRFDGVSLRRDATGDLQVTLRLPQLPLFKGRYTVSAYVLCDRGIHVHSGVERVVGFDVTQNDVHQGIVALPHQWRQGVSP